MSSELYVVVETRFVYDEDDGHDQAEEQPVGVFFDQSHAMAWCDQEMPRHLHWVAVPVLDA